VRIPPVLNRGPHLNPYRTYDEYTSELASGHLSWTPVHESEDFWKENATKLNEKDYEQLK
jgi:V-type H+-transporting ATPase subunit H